MATSESNLEFARRYLAAIERGATGDELAAFYAPDVEQVEFPNRLVPDGARRGLDDLLEGAERGQALLSAQRFEVKNAVTDGDRVALEVRWTGTLAVAAATIPAGGEMRAHIAIFIDFHDGKIARQRNYDCYEPS